MRPHKTEVNLIFYRGADISTADELEKKGVCYYDNGQQDDLFCIMKRRGVNMIRLRIWNDPYNKDGDPYGGGTNDYAVTERLSRRAKEHGMDVLLDFHYSDFWADPGKQFLPKAWQNLSIDKLEAEVYRYTNDVISRLKNEGLRPAMVQVGNEITNGLLWDMGKLPDYKNMARLLHNGIKAVRDADKSINIMLHLDFGGDNKLYRNWFDQAIEHKLDFDTIGLSYYPYWHRKLDDLSHNMNDISARYNKDLIVVETAYGYTLETASGEKKVLEESIFKDYCPYPISPEGQRDFLLELAQRIRAVPNQRGRGFVYWEPAWLRSTWATKAGMKYIGHEGDEGSFWGNQALFDFSGNALPAWEAFKG
jgi:arabinogalactan endo-1,4-beta-galactosidase